MCEHLWQMPVKAFLCNKHRGSISCDKFYIMAFKHWNVLDQHTAVTGWCKPVKCTLTISDIQYYKINVCKLYFIGYNDHAVISRTGSLDCHLFLSHTHTRYVSLHTHKPVISGLGVLYDDSTHMCVHLCPPSRYVPLITLHELAPFLSPLLLLYVGAF